MLSRHHNPTGYALSDERIADTLRVRQRRAAGRDVEIPPPENPRRRRKCARDPALYLRTYFPHIFTNRFTADQRQTIADFVDVIRYGGYRADAAPRGDGKTSIALGLAAWALTNAVRRFVVLVAATGPDAERNNQNIRIEFEINDLLAADYPEICYPIRALEGASQRANLQTVNGARTRMHWTGPYIVLPTVAGSDASGAIVTSRGIDSAIRGIQFSGKRPDLVIIDDCETRESARSPTETLKRMETIERDIAGLSGPGQSIAIFYLCTVSHTDCIADQLTDPKRKPAWRGRRRPLLVTEPAGVAATHWERYIELRREGMIGGDETGRQAHKYYQAHRAEMDAGTKVSNPYRHDTTELPDGTQKQLTTLQFCMDVIADLGRESYDTEYQQKPPAQDVETAGLDAARIQTQITGNPRGHLPPETRFLTAGIDVSSRALHWTVTAWPGPAGHIIDYGTTRVFAPLEGRVTDEENRKALESAILEALTTIRATWADGYIDPATGELRGIDLCLVDSGWRDGPIYEFVRSSPRGQFRASKGYGTGSGQARYRTPTKPGHGTVTGYHWHARRQTAGRVTLYHLDTDHWKNHVHSGFVAPSTRPGSLQLFGDLPVEHRHFAEHLLAEVQTTEFSPGRGTRVYWRQVRRDNHWLDTTAMSCAAAAILKLRFTPTDKPADPAGPPPAPRRKPPTSPRHRKRRVGKLQRMT